MNLLAKFRETALSVLPVTAIVLALGSTAAPLGAAALGRFALGGLLLVVGLTVFLLGVDAGVEPMGERTGAALTGRRNLALLLGVAFAVGFVVTAAEPDVQVFGDQVRGVFPSVRKLSLTLGIAGGVGAFLLVGLLRIVLSLPVKATLLACYAALALAALAAPPDFLGVAFDAGGATTGPMTVPFIMALGLGVAAARGRGEGGFGLTGVASVGPVLAVLLYSLVVDRGGGSAAAAAESAAAAAGGFFAPYGPAARHALREAAVSIFPLFALFLLFKRCLFTMSWRQATRLAIGFLYAFAGLFVFLLGVNGGFMQAGAALGKALGAKAAAGGAGAWALLVGTGLAFGAIVVCAEPAVWVLSEQVEELTGGAIRRRALLVFLSAGTAGAIGLATWRAVAGFPLWWLLVPGYALAFLLMLRSPPLFTAIAFDSGGVASGPLTSTFVLSFTLGAAARSAGGGTDVFGVVALVAMMPLVALQLLGVLYDRGRRKALRGNVPPAATPAAPPAPAGPAPPKGDNA